MRSMMARMGGLVERQTSQAIAAIADRDENAAGIAADLDPQVDALERDVEAMVIRILALRSPVAGDLREVVSALKITGDMERIGDCAASIARRSLRAELLEVLLEFEQGTGGDPEVLEALLRAAAADSGSRPEPRTRALVHRTGMLLVRTTEGAARFDRALVELARDEPHFAGLVLAWLADAPQEWAAVVGPGARRTVEALGGSRPAMTVPMQAAGREHGSLRPA